ncbi:MAG: 4Fe-4S binding protein, partial [Selenomonadaceae bacterium]|nr:4Fe-4S binding protein [Selenomonadaceae bacterium]
NKYPTVNADYCTGCGMCEHVCIADPKAIHVKPRGGAP